MKQIFLILSVVLSLTIQCKQDIFNNPDFKTGAFRIEMEKDSIHLIIDELELGNLKYNNYAREYSIWQNDKKLCYTTGVTSIYNEKNAVHTNINANIPYAELIKSGIDGKCTAQFRFRDTYNNKDYPVAKIDLVISQDEIKEKLAMIEAEKRQLEEKKEADKNELQELKEGLSGEDASLVSSLAGSYRSLDKVQDYQGGPELHKYTLTIRHDQGKYFVSLFGEPNIGGMFAGEIVKISPWPDGTSALTFFNEDERSYVLQISQSGSDYFMQYKPDDSQNWEELGMMKKGNLP